MDASTISNRINAVIQHYGMSDRSFALTCGIKQATLDKQTKGQRGVSIETATSILNTFGEISSDWLILGKGEMIRSDLSSKETARLNKLVDTIATLQEVINDKDDTIASLKERIRMLEAKVG